MQVFLQLQLAPVFKMFLRMYFIIFQEIINLQVQVQIIVCLSMVHYAALVLLFSLTRMPCRGSESALETQAGGLEEVITYWEGSSASPVGARESLKNPTSSNL